MTVDGRDRSRGGRPDARLLATTIADPGRVDRGTLDTWAGALDDVALADAFSRLAAATPGAEVLARDWIGADAEWTAAAGWSAPATAPTPGSGRSWP